MQTERADSGGIEVLTKKALELPSDLADLYKHIVQGLKQQPSEVRKKARFTIMLVNAASLITPLELQHLWKALALPIEE